LTDLENTVCVKNMWECPINELVWSDQSDFDNGRLHSNRIHLMQTSDSGREMYLYIYTNGAERAVIDLKISNRPSTVLHEELTATWNEMELN